jgi:hypothetical protein
VVERVSQRIADGREPNTFNEESTDPTDFATHEASGKDVGMLI